MGLKRCLGSAFFLHVGLAAGSRFLRFRSRWNPEYWHTDSVFHDTGEASPLCSFWVLFFDRFLRYPVCGFGCRGYCVFV